MKVLLVNNKYKEPTEIMARSIAADLQKKGLDVAIDNGVAIPQAYETDLIIVLGGDGTILRAARQYASEGIPVLGVNMGTVGFLSNIELNELDNFVELLISGDYSLDERMMLEVEVLQRKKVLKKVLCLNEITLKSVSARMISLPIEIDGEISGTYRGDGLIVSTPTGSTAYSLSSGGPIVDPRLEAIIITPIASHVISRRPMVLAADKTITFSSSYLKEAFICVDGQVRISLENDSLIKIKRSEHHFKLVNLKRETFFSVIDTKLRRCEGVM